MSIFSNFWDFVKQKHVCERGVLVFIIKPVLNCNSFTQFDGSAAFPLLPGRRMTKGSVSFPQRVAGFYQES